MQDMPPFNLLLRYMAADADVSPDNAKHIDTRSAISNAMRGLNREKKVELVDFCDKFLSSDQDHKALAQVFEDEHLHFVWHSQEGPKRYLTLIRDVAQDQLRGSDKR